MPDLIPPAPARSEVARPLELVYLPRPNPRYWLHGLLLLATLFTTLAVGAHMQFNFEHNQPAFALSDDEIFPMSWAFQQPSRLLLGVPFASALMLILLAHELGHYLCCRYYGVYATLPFFIPAPTLFGTLGAFIRIRSPIRSRPALFDIGIAGPIAGFILATAVLFLALPLSKVLPPGSGNSEIELGYPLIFRLAWYVLPLAELKVHSHAFDAINFHPTAIAAWVGMFATALNLLPGGQLDGGHIVFSIAPRAHKLVSRLTILALIPMAFYFWTGWLLWAVLLGISGMRHPVVAEWPEVRGSRRWLALFAFLMLVLTFSPAPLWDFSLLEFLRAWRAAH
ncbi:MAG TPA: site-2 protease family protein [Terriglobales bacterium]|nr:site-2 protease family protein [Terriglobales bacterium]